MAAARARPESHFHEGGWSANEWGLQAEQAIDEGSTGRALVMLRSAAEAELLAAGGIAFAEALTLLKLWIDEQTASRGCLDCGAEKGRPCVVNSRTGQPIAREWIHAARFAITI